MNSQKKLGVFLAGCLLLFSPRSAKADFWGGDLPLLAEIVAKSIEQIARLESIVGNGKDSLQFMRDINQGLRDAMRLQDTMNRTLKGGNWNLADMNDILHEMEQLYGKIPMTAEAKTQSMHDVTVAESIQLHNDAFRYADSVDPEAERLKLYAEQASPQGAAKASLQAQGVTIHVLDQLLRTNAAILKVQSERLAMDNRKSKLQSDQFRQQYSELGQVLGDSRGGYELPSLSDPH
jgi:hypothetical protein